jgi:hypothetical protein
MFLQCTVVVFLIIIASMIYYNVSITSELDTDMKNIKMECPQPEVNVNIPKSHTQKSPSCPQQKENCPSVDDIVSGIFPGRNTGLMRGGSYFDVDASKDIYEKTHEYTAFEKQGAFPDTSYDSGLRPLSDNNPYVRSNNSLENENINTSPDTSLTRMSEGLKSGSNKNNNPQSATSSKAP